MATATTTTTCRGCGARVALRARVCFVCKAPDPTIGRARTAAPEGAAHRPLPLWLAALTVLIVSTALVALASLLRG